MAKSGKICYLLAKYSPRLSGLVVESQKNPDLIDVNIDVDTTTVQESLTQNFAPNPTVSLIPKDIPKKHLINNLLVMAIKWRRNTSYTGAQDIIKLVNISSGTSNSNSSKYYWKKILDRYSQNVSSYYICEHCNNYLGPEKDCPTECGECHKKIDLKVNKGSYSHLLLTDQLWEIFETTDAYHLYSVNHKKLNKYAIEDIFDGKLYKKRQCLTVQIRPCTLFFVLSMS
ncbi:hypothetical protein KQX54_001946 [Cotesia glomerata]|uniref:Uncharacterized protein n=1 Tax=Cotesia glomerata TaxID=32391 RepID=A0AAV7IXJ3_COTGL|nr:hypothetical protein KQX54_001946 [Cotesia glomerata]